VIYYTLLFILSAYLAGGLYFFLKIQFEKDGNNYMPLGHAFSRQRVELGLVTAFIWPLMFWLR
jgi:hypothetical protein